MRRCINSSSEIFPENSPITFTISSGLIESYSSASTVYNEKMRFSHRRGNTIGSPPVLSTIQQSSSLVSIRVAIPALRSWSEERRFTGESGSNKTLFTTIVLLTPSLSTARSIRSPAMLISRAPAIPFTVIGRIFFTLTSRDLSFMIEIEHPVSTNTRNVLIVAFVANASMSAVICAIAAAQTTFRFSVR